MDKTDRILLWVVLALAILAAGLRPLLAKKQGNPLSLGWTLQGAVFPLLLAAGLVLDLSGVPEAVLPAVALGLVEELICGAIRRRRTRRR